MAEYIERKAALAFQNEVEPLLCRNVVTHDIMSATKDADLVKYLQSIPAADVRPVVHGKWIHTGGKFSRNKTVDRRILTCSICGNILSMEGVNAGRGDANFCPNCGARMVTGDV